jgi:hypothetical protein
MADNESSNIAARDWRPFDLDGSASVAETLLGDLQVQSAGLRYALGRVCRYVEFGCFVIGTIPGLHCAPTTQLSASQGPLPLSTSAILFPIRSSISRPVFRVQNTLAKIIPPICLS